MQGESCVITIMMTFIDTCVGEPDSVFAASLGAASFFVVLFFLGYTQFCSFNVLLLELSLHCRVTTSYTIIACIYLFIYLNASK